MIKILTLAGILLLAGIASGGTSYVQANGQSIAKINDTGVFYYHPDHLGSTSAITNSDGIVIEEQVNLPFGQLISGSEKYGFTGKEFDETELNYYGARYYSPLTGRFLTVDPAKDGMNWYPYANNPLKYIDPDGTSNLPAPVPEAGPLDIPTDPVSLVVDGSIWLGTRGTPYKSRSFFEFVKNFIHWIYTPEETIMPLYNKQTRTFTTYGGSGTSNEIPPSFTEKEAKLLEKVMNLDPVKNPSGIKVRKGEVTFEMLEYLAGNPEGIEYALYRAKRKWYQLTE